MTQCERRETNPCGWEAFQSLMKTYANKTERPGWLRSGVSSSAIECGSGTGTPEEGDGKRAWVRGLREEVAAAVPTVCAGSGRLPSTVQ